MKVIWIMIDMCNRIIIIICFIPVKIYWFVIRGQIIIDMLVTVIIRFIRFRSEIDMVYILWISAIVKRWTCLSRIVSLGHISRRRCVSCCCVRGSKCYRKRIIFDDIFQRVTLLRINFFLRIT